MGTPSIYCTLAGCVLMIIPACCYAGSTSGDYWMQLESIDGGGGLISSGEYSGGGSIGGMGGVSGAAMGEINKAGYLGQIYEAESLQLTAPSQTLDPQTATQIGAEEMLDDGTLLTLNPANLQWKLSGPVSISRRGQVMANMIYEDTAAVVSGSFEGFSAEIDFEVVNQAFDAWQAEYFGPNNPQAASTADADGTGETNLFKYIAGLNPTDPTSRFSVSTAAASGGSGGIAVTFSPITAGRTYILQSTINLSNADWQPVAGALQSASGNTMTIIDPDSSERQKFYRIQISQ